MQLLCGIPWVPPHVDKLTKLDVSPLSIHQVRKLELKNNCPDNCPVGYPSAVVLVLVYCSPPFFCLGLGFWLSQLRSQIQELHARTNGTTSMLWAYWPFTSCPWQARNRFNSRHLDELVCITSLEFASMGMTRRSYSSQLPAQRCAKKGNGIAMCSDSLWLTWNPRPTLWP